MTTEQNIRAQENDPMEEHREKVMDYWRAHMLQSFEILRQFREYNSGSQTSRDAGETEVMIAGNQRLVHMGYMAQASASRALTAHAFEHCDESILISSLNRSLLATGFDAGKLPVLIELRSDYEILNPERLSLIKDSSIKYICVDCTSRQNIRDLFRELFEYVTQSAITSKLHPDYCFFIHQKYSNLD